MASASAPTEHHAADCRLEHTIDGSPAAHCRVGAHEDAAARVREGQRARTPQGGAQTACALTQPGTETGNINQGGEPPR